MALAVAKGAVGGADEDATVGIGEEAVGGVDEDAAATVTCADRSAAAGRVVTAAAGAAAWGAS
eukprot:13532056-Alexandrium_andersonii.AAC.1